MSVSPVAILKTGLVTSVGMSAPVACAAFRAKLTNPSETRFIDSAGEWIMAHQVPLGAKRRGLSRLASMAIMAIEEAMADVPRSDWPRIPLLLCVAEKDRPGRVMGIEDKLLTQIQVELGVQFASQSTVVDRGRVGVAVALLRARALLQQPGIEFVLVGATDSLISWPTLSHYERHQRLLTPDNSNGFMPGEGAGALLVGKPRGHPALLCTGFGFSIEKAHIDSEEPLRADGLRQAINAALAEAGCAMHEMDYRITDLSGEQYYFKEAALALSRTLRERKEEFDLWHPAECTGEPGALAGASIIALADTACRKAFTKGPAILAHMANDSGQRAALTLHFRGA